MLSYFFSTLSKFEDREESSSTAINKRLSIFLHLVGFTQKIEFQMKIFGVESNSIVVQN